MNIDKASERVLFRRADITGDEEMNFAPRSMPSLSYDDLCRLSDEQLVQRAAARCPEALTVLFDRYHRLVFDVALRIVRDPGEAEEVVQTVFSISIAPSLTLTLERAY